MRTISFAQAMAEALDEALEADPRVTILGGGFTGVSGSPGAAHFAAVQSRHPDRYLTPPISELGLCGIATGAALTGLRPLVDVGTGSFAFEAFAAIANEAAVAHYTSNGQSHAPVVFHLHSGIRGAGATQHSQAPHALFWQTPGLRILMPGSPADAKGLLRTALLRSPDPCIFVNHYRLLDVEGPVPDGACNVPFGRAAVRREGEDVTVVACGVMVPRALEAAEVLAREGVSVEVVDPRTLVPLDMDTILASVRRTGRLVAADETPASCGAAGELLARVCEAAFSALRAAPRRVASPDVPIPFSQPLEDRVTPTAARVAAAVRAVVGR